MIPMNIWKRTYGHYELDRANQINIWAYNLIIYKIPRRLNMVSK